MANHRALDTLVAFAVAAATSFPLSAAAAVHHHGHASHATHTASKHSSSKTKVAHQRSGKRAKVASSRTSSSRRLSMRKARLKQVLAHRSGKVQVACAHYTYPVNFFMWSAPSDCMTPINGQTSEAIQSAFETGEAGDYTPQELVQAGIFESDPLRGGIFVRRQPVKFIILHSTETGRPADAPRVIHSWNRGMRHPGAQYVVDRDGVIYQTVDPEFGTVHVDVHRTLNGVNNDNAIGIEMVRSGDQEYTEPQLASVTRLVSYLQAHFQVNDEHIFGHGQIQPSDRTDPVRFDWTAFHTAKASLKVQSAMLVKKQHAGHTVVLPASSTLWNDKEMRPLPSDLHPPSLCEAICGMFNPALLKANNDCEVDWNQL